MTLEQLKEKILSLIEELNPDSQLLTDDPDIAAKLDSVIDQVSVELSRVKKLPRVIPVEAKRGQQLTFEDLGELVGREVYQLDRVSGADHILRGGGTVVEFLASGEAVVEVFVYPAAVSAGQELELSRDALEVLPYGVAADLLKSDISAGYGSVYAQRYEGMLRQLDSRYALGHITFQGGML